MLILATIIVIGVVVLIAMAAGAIIGIVIDLIASLILGDMLGTWLAGLIVFPFDITLASVVLIFLAIEFAKYKIKHRGGKK